MGIELSTLTSRQATGGPGATAGDMREVDVRPEISPLAPSRAAVATGLLGGAEREGEAHAANRLWTAGISSRARGGAILSGSNAFGTEVSPINLPEAIRGRMVAISI